MGKPSEGINEKPGVPGFTSATAVGGGGGLTALPRLCPTKPLWDGSKKEAQGPSPGLTLHSPSLLRDLVVRKVDHPDSTDAVIKDKNILLHSCNTAGVEQKQ